MSVLSAAKCCRKLVLGNGGSVLCSARRLSQSGVNPVVYLAKHELPPWHKLQISSNMNVMVLPNTSITRFLLEGTSTEFTDGDQVMSVWLASRASAAPTTTFQALPDAQTWVQCQPNSGHLSVACSVPVPAIAELLNAVPNPCFVLHVPLKTSIDLSTTGNACVQGTDCDDVTIRSLQGNCEVAGVKVSNALSVEAMSTACDAGCVDIADTVQASVVSVLAARRITANRVLALDVDLSVESADDVLDGSCDSSAPALHAESVYAQSIRIKSAGSVKSAVLSADKCQICGEQDVTIGALSGKDVSVTSTHGRVKCSLDQWSTACFVSPKGRTHVKKPFSSEGVKLAISPNAANQNLWDHVAIRGED